MKRTAKLKKLKYDWYLLAVIFFGLVPILWFKKNLMIAGGDESWLINPLGFLPDVTHAWSDKLYNLGGPNIYLPYSQTLTPFWLIAKFFGFSLTFTEKIWICLLFSLPGIAIYYLVKKLFADIPNNRLSAFFSAILYMFNLYVIQIGAFQTNTKLTLFALPILLLLFIKGLESNRYKLYYASGIAAVITLIGSAFVNIAVVSVIPIVLLAYLLYFIATNRKNALSAITFTLSAIAIWLLVNIYWLVPYAQNMLAFNSSSGSSVFSFEQTNTGQFVNFWRFLGSWGWKETHNFIQYFPFADNYDRFPLIFLSYMPICIAILATAIYRKNKYVAFFSFLSILGIFLAKGATPPLGSWYKFTYEHYKFLWIFREPWAKFTPIYLFSISILFGLGASSLIYRINQKKLRKPYSFLLILFCTLLVAYPLITGEVIWHQNTGLMRSNYTQIPNYWDDVNEYLKTNTQQGDRVLLLPPTGYAVGYNWQNGFFAGDTPAMILLDRATLKYTSYPSNNADKIINEMYEKLYSKPELISDYAKMLGFRYVLTDKDVEYNYAYYIKNPPLARKYATEITQKIESLSDLSKIYESGSLSLYQIANLEYQPVAKLIDSNGNEIQIDISSENSSRFVISVGKIDRDAEYTLRLNNNFSALWQAKICNDDSCGLVEQNRHVISDNYANVWKITDLLSNSKIILEYSPENKMNKLKNVSILSIIILFVANLLLFLKTKKKRVK